MEDHINRLLPDELLNKIFELVKSETFKDAITRRTSDEEKDNFQIIISRVCRRWFSCTFRNPLLWNYVTFEPGRRSLPQAQRNIELSASAPLDVSMSVTDNLADPSTTTQEDARLFLSLVRLQSRRWRTVHLRIPAILAMENHPLFEDEAPFLEQISIHISHPSLTMSGYAPVRLPSQAPLTALSIGMYPLRWNEWTARNITELCLGPFDALVPGPTMKELSTILSLLSSQLTSLTVRGRWQAIRNEDIFDTEIVLHALSSFTIHTNFAEYVLRIIEGCQFPVLENLEVQISFGRVPSSNVLYNLCQAPHRFSSVKNLALGLVGEPTGLFASVVRNAFPNVTTVRLLPYTPLDSSLAIFIAQSWPSLSKLSLAEAELGNLRLLVETRSRTTATKLKSLHLEVARGTLYKTDYDAIASYINEWSIRLVRPTSGWVYPSIASKLSLRTFSPDDLVRDRLQISRPNLLFQHRVVRQL